MRTDRLHRGQQIFYAQVVDRPGRPAVARVLIAEFWARSRWPQNVRVKTADHAWPIEAPRQWLAETPEAAAALLTARLAIARDQHLYAAARLAAAQAAHLASLRILWPRVPEENAIPQT